MPKTGNLMDYLYYKSSVSKDQYTFLQASCYKSLTTLLEKISMQLTSKKYIVGHWFGWKVFFEKSHSQKNILELIKTKSPIT